MVDYDGRDKSGVRVENETLFDRYYLNVRLYENRHNLIHILINSYYYISTSAEGWNTINYSNSIHITKL